VREAQASETAVLPAVLRAAHLVLDGTPKIFSDSIATSLLEEWSTSQILERQAVLQSPVMRHLRSMLVVRSRLAEDELHKAVDAGASQYVLLGAGLDTFGFRLPPWARSLRIVEVDHPASQEFKRDRVNRAALAISANLDYCAIDFEATTLEEGLRRSPFDPTVPTYFSWLGVIPYLTHPSIEATLGFVSALPAPATIGFTFVVPDASLTGIDLEASELSAKGAGARGEPWLTRVELAALKPWLTDLGFDRVEHITPQVCGERFYRGRTDGLSPPVVEQFATAHRGRRDPTQNR
jgi:methyltransferase (TIGR00027 family)